MAGDLGAFLTDLADKRLTNRHRGARSLAEFLKSEDGRQAKLHITQNSRKHGNDDGAHPTWFRLADDICGVLEDDKGKSITRNTLDCWDALATVMGSAQEYGDFLADIVDIVIKLAQQMLARKENTTKNNDNQANVIRTVASVVMIVLSSPVYACTLSRQAYEALHAQFVSYLEAKHNNNHHLATEFPKLFASVVVTMWNAYPYDPQPFFRKHILPYFRRYFTDGRPADGVPDQVLLHGLHEYASRHIMNILHVYELLLNHIVTYIRTSPHDWSQKHMRFKLEIIRLLHVGLCVQTRLPAPFSVLVSVENIGALHGLVCHELSSGDRLFTTVNHAHASDHDTSIDEHSYLVYEVAAHITAILEYRDIRLEATNKTPADIWSLFHVHGDRTTPIPPTPVLVQFMYVFLQHHANVFLFTPSSSSAAAAPAASRRRRRRRRRKRALEIIMLVTRSLCAAFEDSSERHTAQKSWVIAVLYQLAAVFAARLAIVNTQQHIYHHHRHALAAHAYQQYALPATCWPPPKWIDINTLASEGGDEDDEKKGEEENNDDDDNDAAAAADDDEEDVHALWSRVVNAMMSRLSNHKLRDALYSLLAQILHVCVLASHHGHPAIVDAANMRHIDRRLQEHDILGRLLHPTLAASSSSSSKIPLSGSSSSISFILSASASSAAAAVASINHHHRRRSSPSVVDMPQPPSIDALVLVNELCRAYAARLLTAPHSDDSEQVLRPLVEFRSLQSRGNHVALQVTHRRVHNCFGSTASLAQFEAYTSEAITTLLTLLLDNNDNDKQHHQFCNTTTIATSSSSVTVPFIVVTPVQSKSKQSCPFPGQEFWSQWQLQDDISGLPSLPLHDAYHQHVTPLPCDEVITGAATQAAVLMNGKLFQRLLYHVRDNVEIMRQHFENHVRVNAQRSARYRESIECGKWAAYYALLLWRMHRLTKNNHDDDGGGETAVDLLQNVITILATILQSINQLHVAAMKKRRPLAQKQAAGGRSKKRQRTSGAAAAADNDDGADDDDDDDDDDDFMTIADSASAAASSSSSASSSLNDGVLDACFAAVLHRVCCEVQLSPRIWLNNALAPVCTAYSALAVAVFDAMSIALVPVHQRSLTAARHDKPLAEVVLVQLIPCLTVLRMANINVSNDRVARLSARVTAWQDDCAVRCRPDLFLPLLRLDALMLNAPENVQRVGMAFDGCAALVDAEMTTTAAPGNRDMLVTVLEFMHMMCSDLRRHVVVLEPAQLQQIGTVVESSLASLHEKLYEAKECGKVYEVDRHVKMLFAQVTCDAELLEWCELAPLVSQETLWYHHDWAVRSYVCRLFRSFMDMYEHVNVYTPLETRIGEELAIKCDPQRRRRRSSSSSKNNNNNGNAASLLPPDGGRVMTLLAALRALALCNDDELTRRVLYRLLVLVHTHGDTILPFVQAVYMQLCEDLAAADNVTSAMAVAVVNHDQRARSPMETHLDYLLVRWVTSYSLVDFPFVMLRVHMCQTPLDTASFGRVCVDSSYVPTYTAFINAFQHVIVPIASTYCIKNTAANEDGDDCATALVAVASVLNTTPQALLKQHFAATFALWLTLYEAHDANSHRALKVFTLMQQLIPKSEHNIMCFECLPTAVLRLIDYSRLSTISASTSDAPDPLNLASYTIDGLIRVIDRVYRNNSGRSRGTKWSAFDGVASLLCGLDGECMPAIFNHLRYCLSTWQCLSHRRQIHDFLLLLPEKIGGRVLVPAILHHLLRFALWMIDHRQVYLSMDARTALNMLLRIVEHVRTQIRSKQNLNHQTAYIIMNWYAPQVLITLQRQLQMRQQESIAVVVAAAAEDGPEADVAMDDDCVRVALEIAQHFIDLERPPVPDRVVLPLRTLLAMLPPGAPVKDELKDIGETVVGFESIASLYLRTSAELSDAVGQFRASSAYTHTLPVHKHVEALLQDLLTHLQQHPDALSKVQQQEQQLLLAAAVVDDNINGDSTTILGRLTSTLIQHSSWSHSSRMRQLASACLGEIGPLSSSSSSSASSSSSSSSSSPPDRARYCGVVGVLTDLMGSSHAQLVCMASNALSSILSDPDENSEKFSDLSDGRQRLLSPWLSAGQAGRPLLARLAVITTLPQPAWRMDRWSPQPGESFEDWVCTCTYHLLADPANHMDTNRLLSSCAELVYLHPPFAARMLKYVVAQWIQHPQHTGEQQLTSLARVFNQLCGVTDKDHRFDLVIFDVLQYIRTMVRYERCAYNEKSYHMGDWVRGVEQYFEQKLNYESLARAALRCSLPYTALVYINFWYDAYGACARMRQVLMDVCGIMDEPDTLYGVMRLSHAFDDANNSAPASDLMADIAMYQHEQQWDKFLSASDFVMQQQQQQQQQHQQHQQHQHEADVLLSYRQLGCFHSMARYLEHPHTDPTLRPYYYEAAWRASNWNAVFPTASSSSSSASSSSSSSSSMADEHIFHCLRAVWSKDDGLLTRHIQMARTALLNQLLMVGAENYHVAFPAVVQLQMLTDIRKVGNAYRSGGGGGNGGESLKRLYTDFQRRMDATSGDHFQLREPLLAVWSVILSHIAPNELSMKHTKYFASMARASRQYRIAAQVLLQPYHRQQHRYHHHHHHHQQQQQVIVLDDSDDDDDVEMKDANNNNNNNNNDSLLLATLRLHLERAHIAWASMQHDRSMYLVDTVVRALEPRVNVASTADEMDLFVNAQCLLGEWQSVSHYENATVINARLESTKSRLESWAHVNEHHELRGHVAYQLGRFHERHFQSLLDKKQSPEFEEHVRIYKEHLCTIESFERAAADSSQPTDQRRAVMAVLGKHRQEAEHDRQVIEALNTSLRQSIEAAMVNYCECLAVTDAHDDVVPDRLIALWFEHYVTYDRITDIIGDHLPRLAATKFLPLFYQISSRLGPAAAGANGRHSLLTPDARFHHTVHQLVSKMALHYPYHTLYHLFALTNGDQLHTTARLQQGLETNEERKAAAHAIIDTLRRHDDGKYALVVEAHEKFISACIAVASREYKKKVTMLKTKDTELFKCMRPELFHVLPVPAADIPLVPFDDLLRMMNMLGVSRLSSSIQFANTGIHRPLILKVYDCANRWHRQLIKPQDDLRQDAVMEQLFGVVNGLLRKEPETRLRRLKIRTYNVIPLTPCVGLVQWVENTISLSDYLIDSQTGAHVRYRRPEQKKSHSQWRQHMSEAHAYVRTHNLTGKRREDHLHARYMEVCADFLPVFRHFLTERFLDPHTWFEKRLAYIRSIAVTSMVGYIVGLGDRHTQNILIDQITAELVHIDLGIAFDQGKLLRTPELVPFRLTREMVDGCGVAGVDGILRRCCEETLKVMRQHEELLLTILEVFIHDPLYRWALSPEKLQAHNGNNNNHQGDDRLLKMQRSDGSGGAGGGGGGGGGGAGGSSQAKRALVAIQQKLRGVDHGDTLSVEGQVRSLLNQAQDPRNLCCLYEGWASWL